MLTGQGACRPTPAVSNEVPAAAWPALLPGALAPGADAPGSVGAAEPRPLESHAAALEQSTTRALEQSATRALGQSATRALGRYRLLSKIGQGGMGAVHLAVARGPANVLKLLVVKELAAVLAEASSARELFLAEARLTTRFAHPNVVQTFEVLVDERGTLHLVMEYVEGQTLAALLGSEGRASLGLELLVRILVSALRGLHYAHELTDYDGSPLGVVHRDISPGNVMVSYDGQVKVLDFGVARVGAVNELSESGVFRGTVRYASPEQAGCEQLDRRSDLFGVGVMLWEVLAGRRLWEGQNDTQVLIALVNGEIPALPARVSAATPALADVVRKALAFDREQRFSSAKEMADTLEDWLDARNAPRETEVGPAVERAFSAQRSERRAAVDAHLRSLADAPLEHSVTTEGGVLAPPRLSRAPGRAGAAAVAAVSALAVLALAGVLLVVAPASRESAPSSSLAPWTNSSATPASSPSSSAVQLELSATPSNARWKLDGRALPTNPWRGSIPRDGRQHELVVEADGHTPRTLSVAAERDQHIGVGLQPSAAAAAPSASGAATTTRPVGRRAVAPSRGIDELDPYRP